MLGHSNPNTDISSVTAPFMGVCRRFRLPPSHVLFVHSPIPMKINLIWKQCMEKKFIFSFCPRCRLKSHLFVVIGKFMNHWNFVWEHVQGLLKYFLHWVSRHSALTNCLPCWCVRAALPLLQETTLMEHTDISLPSHPLPFQNFEQAKYIVSYWCPMSSKSSVKSSLCSGNALSFGKQNNFDFLLNHYSTWSAIVMNCQ